MPIGPDNPYGNAFTRRVDAADAASPTAPRMADGVGRRGSGTWSTRASTNRLGQPVGYALHPQGQPTLLADPASSIARRAAFATRHLWVTAVRPGASATRPATSSTSTRAAPGCPRASPADRDIDGEDIVLWHTFGLTHFPRPEDWPVMPVDHAGFTLKPVGFFDRNPTLDVPEPRSAHCHTAEGHTAEGHTGGASCH